MKLSLLKNKNFLWLMVGKAVSLLGSDMQQFALSLYVLSLTGSATIFSSMLAISIFPRILLTPIAGVFGDWFDRKKSIILMDMINGMLIGVYGVYYFIHGELSVGSIYLLVILLETTEIFLGAAMAAVIPSIVKEEDLLDANSLKSMITSLFTTIAPVLGAGLYGFLGMLGVLTLNALSFIVSALSEMFITIPKFHKTPEKINGGAFKKDFMVGLTLIRDHKMLKNIMGLAMILNFCLAPLFSVGMLYIIKEVFNGSDFQVGYFSTILAFSMVITPVVLTGFARKVEIGKLLIYSFLVVSFLIVGIGLISSTLVTSLFSSFMVPLGLLLVISFIIGIFVTLANIALGTMFDTMVPKEVMGRSSSVMGLAMTIAAPIGQVVLGLAIDVMNPSVPIVVLGVIMLMAVIYYKKLFIKKIQSVDAAV